MNLFWGIMKLKISFFFFFLIFVSLESQASKEHVWKPKNFSPQKHPTILSGDTVFLSLSDNRGIPSNAKIHCSSEELLESINNYLCQAYPNTTFIRNDKNYNNKNIEGHYILKIGIQKYYATYDPGWYVQCYGYTTFISEIICTLPYTNYRNSKESAYYSNKSTGGFGVPVMKKCLNEAFVAAFEDMCRFIDAESVSITNKMNQPPIIGGAQLSPSNSNSNIKEQLVDPSILSRISLSNSSKEISPKEIYKKYNNAVFLIYTSNGEQIAQGSGFVVSKDGIAVSNYHVFKGTYKGLEVIKLPNGETHKITDVYGFSEKFDYIVFQLDGNSFDYIPIHLGEIEIGDEVYAIGSPRGLVNTISNGLISQRHNDFIFQISVPIDHGSSGGALINKYGEAIGITSGGIDTSIANLNFAYDIKAIFSKPY